MKIRIVRIDKIGYPERDIHHPQDSDKNSKCTVLRGEAYTQTPWVALAKVSKPQDVPQTNQIVVWTVVTDDGRILEVMEHEARVL